MYFITIFIYISTIVKISDQDQQDHHVADFILI
jgi:hypothetical protein